MRSSLDYEISTLHKLESGTVGLGVPVRDEVVQIGATDLDTMRELQVTIDPPQIRVARVDSKLLQIDDLAAGADPDHLSVFNDPVSEVVVRAIPIPGRERWRLVSPNDAEVSRPDSLEIFLILIGNFALRKQVQQRSPGSTVTAAELLNLLDK